MSACPFCDSDVGQPFENLRDAYDDEEGLDDVPVVKVWTMHHSCSRAGPNIWVEGATSEECLSRWNSRPVPIG